MRSMALESVSFNRWPYPRWIAHRGAGQRAPENTLAAFRLGAAQGYRMFECDVKLSIDAVPFLLHDSTLERTSNGTGLSSQHTWAELSQLDAGIWHSPPYAGETLPSLAAVAHYCLEKGLYLNIEIKPNPGQEEETGRVVAQQAAQLWQSAAKTHSQQSLSPPLLTSFNPGALAAAQKAAAWLPRGLLLDHWPPDWPDNTQTLACVALVCEQRLWTADRVQQAHELGLRTLTYTVNEPKRAEELLRLGVDGIITDAIDLIRPSL